MPPAFEPLEEELATSSIDGGIAEVKSMAKKASSDSLQVVLAEEKLAEVSPIVRECLFSWECHDIFSPRHKYEM